ncbi:MAG: alpha/beta hydrolase-fold protein [Candidatus Odinarchaeota archaeon]
MSNDLNELVTFGNRLKFSSEILGEERPLLIHLPDGYYKTRDHYPVFYLLNGDYEPRFVNTAASIELLSGTGRIPNMIVIGIADVNHVRDWFPFKVQGDKGGGGENALKFITEELMPFVDKNYRTVPYKILAGGSNTAMFTVYALLKKPEAFNAYIAVSPMLGWNSEFFTEMAEKCFAQNSSLDTFLYLTYGTKEYDQVVLSTKDFAKLLEDKAPEGLEWELKILEGEGHVPLPWVHNSLISMFSDFEFPQEQFLDEDPDEIKAFYDILSRKYGFKIKIPEEVLSDLAYELTIKEQLEKSIKVCKLFVEEHPSSSGAQYMQGIVYQKNGDKELAMKSYKKALELDPKNARIESKIKELRQEEQS